MTFEGVPQKPQPKSIEEIYEDGVSSKARIAVWEAELSTRPKPIESDKAKNLLAKTEIHGSPFNGQELTTDILKGNKLEPKYSVNLDLNARGRKFAALSDPYLLDGGRVGVVAYVSIDDGQSVVARSYYRSNSQGLWRYLPSYTLSWQDKSHINWYSKGRGEESINVPLVLQKSLAKLSGNGKSILELENPSLIFAGSSRVGAGSGDSYFSHVEEVGAKLRGNFYQENGKVPPTELTFTNDHHKPLFKRMLSTWEQPSTIYGAIEVEAYPSVDGTLVYLICRDQRHRVWVGAVDNINAIGSTGLRNIWIDAGNLTTPAYEYAEQAHGYGNHQDQNGAYVDMFKNYLAHSPIVQEYIAARDVPPVIPKKMDISIAREYIITGKYDLVEARVKELSKGRPLSAATHEEIDGYYVLLRERRNVVDKQPKIRGGETIVIKGDAVAELETIDRILIELDRLRVSSL